MRRSSGIGFLLLAAALSATGCTTHLSDLSPEEDYHLWQGLGVDAPPWGGPLVIGDREFEKGLVTHPENMAVNGGKRGGVVYALDGRYRVFRAQLGHAKDEAKPCASGTTAHYFVIVDGETVATGPFPAPPAVTEVKAGLVGARTLTLEVDDGGNSNWCDHAGWGDAAATAWLPW